MIRSILLIAVALTCNWSHAEEREVATQQTPTESASTENETSTPDGRSFFNPKTEDDVKAMATLNEDLQYDLGDE